MSDNRKCGRMWGQTIARNWSLYFSFNTNRFIRECPELRACVLVDPESVWAAFHYLRRERLIENATSAPGVHEEQSWYITDFDRHD